jgi:hypothetical protein
MFSLATAAAGLTLADKSDYPKKYHWAWDCQWDDVEWKDYKWFHGLAPHAHKSRDQCMALYGYFVGVGDLDQDLAIDKCEHTFGCMAVAYKPGQSDEAGKKNQVHCVKNVTKWHAKVSPISLKHLAMNCAAEHPNLDGSPLDHDLFSFAEEEEEEEIEEAEDFMMMWTANQQKYLNTMKKVFAECDKNHTGQLYWQEYWQGHKAYWKKTFGTTEAQCQAVKAQYKKSFDEASGGDGLLSWAEYEQWVRTHVA